MGSAFSIKELGNDTYFLTADSSVLDISTDEIATEAGYGKGAVPEYFNDLIAESIKQCKIVSSISCGFRIFPVDIKPETHDCVITGGQTFNCQKIITAQLRYAEKVALFACTIGSEIETLAARYFEEGDAVVGHFIDMVASTAVEQVTDKLHYYISEMIAQQQLNVTNRFSPGYCGWPVSEQQKLFSLLPERFCGITLTESALMLPKKSTSGIIGIGSKVKKEPYYCKTCTRKECTYRTYLSGKTKSSV
jgi:hypothetical protein